MPRFPFGCGAVAAAALYAIAGAAHAQIMIIGNDEKVGFDAELKQVQNPPGKDTVSIVDMSKPAALKIIASIPLMNTVIGPPTNLAVTPSRDLALVANSINPQQDGNAWKNVPDDKVFVIDLKENPPKIIATVTAGKQPSGMAINAKGDLALVCNRADGTVSVLSITGKDVKVSDTVTVGAAGDSVSAVAITPDGKRALVAKAAANKIALLSIDGGKVSYDKRDLPAGIFPYNVAIAPNGKIALTADNGNSGSSDGNVDTVSVIDLEANPVRVIDHITVGDSPEGLAISPQGNLAVAIEASGSNVAKSNWFHHDGGTVRILRIDGKKVTNAGGVTVGGLPEGAVFSADGRYLYVGNFIDGDLSVLKINGTTLTPAGRLKLPGHPASMRGGPQ